MQNTKLQRDSTGLLIIDVQEKLYPHIQNPCEMLHVLQQTIKGFQILKLPIAITEQYPEGLGFTVTALKQLLPKEQIYYKKTTFSALSDETIKANLLQMPVTQWVLVGIEAHVCVLQTAKDLANEGKEVVVLNNAISSRSVYDFSTAIAEMRDAVPKIRVSSLETVLFELLRESKAPEFKQISALIK